MGRFGRGALKLESQSGFGVPRRAKAPRAQERAYLIATGSRGRVTAPLLRASLGPQFGPSSSKFRRRLECLSCRGLMLHLLQAKHRTSGRWRPESHRNRQSTFSLGYWLLFVKHLINNRCPVSRNAPNSVWIWSSVREVPVIKDARNVT